MTDDIYSTTNSTEYRSAYIQYDIQSIVQLWQTTFTVQHTVLSTDRQPDDIQGRVQLWQTTFTVYDKQYWVQIGNQMIYRVEYNFDRRHLQYDKQYWVQVGIQMIYRAEYWVQVGIQNRVQLNRRHLSYSISLRVQIEKTTLPVQHTVLSTGWQTGTQSLTLLCHAQQAVLKIRISRRIWKSYYWLMKTNERGHLVAQVILKKMTRCCNMKYSVIIAWSGSVKSIFKFFSSWFEPNWAPRNRLKWFSWNYWLRAD